MSNTTMIYPLSVTWPAPAVAGKRVSGLNSAGGDPPMASYQARAAATALERIVFAGRKDEIENYYAAAAQRSGKLFALLCRADDPSPGQAGRKVAEDNAWTRHFERLDALLQRGSRRAQVCVS